MLDLSHSLWKLRKGTGLISISNRRTRTDCSNGAELLGESVAYVIHLVALVTLSQVCLSSWQPEKPQSPHSTTYTQRVFGRGFVRLRLMFHVALLLTLKQAMR